MCELVGNQLHYSMCDGNNMYLMQISSIAAWYESVKLSITFHGSQHARIFNSHVISFTMCTCVDWQWDEIKRFFSNHWASTKRWARCPQYVSAIYHSSLIPFLSLVQAVNNGPHSLHLYDKRCMLYLSVSLIECYFTNYVASHWPVVSTLLEWICRMQTLL